MDGFLSLRGADAFGALKRVAGVRFNLGGQNTSHRIQSSEDQSGKDVATDSPMFYCPKATIPTKRVQGYAIIRLYERV